MSDRMRGRNEGPQAPADGPADERLVQAIAAHWKPAALDAPGRARFDARLRERIDAADTRRRFGGRAILAAPLAAAVALAWLFGGAAPDPAVEGPQVVARLDDSDVALWEWELLLGSETGADDAAGDRALPDEYVAIASAFLSDE